MIFTVKIYKKEFNELVLKDTIEFNAQNRDDAKVVVKDIIKSKNEKTRTINWISERQLKVVLHSKKMTRQPMPDNKKNVALNKRISLNKRRKERILKKKT